MDDQPFTSMDEIREISEGLAIPKLAGKAGGHTRWREATMQYTNPYQTARAARRKRNMPKLAAIAFGLVGVLVAHVAELPPELRPFVEMAGEAVAVIGAVLYERRP